MMKVRRTSANPNTIAPSRDEDEYHDAPQENASEDNEDRSESRAGGSGLAPAGPTARGALAPHLARRGVDLAASQSVGGRRP